MKAFFACLFFAVVLSCTNQTSPSHNVKATNQTSSSHTVKAIQSVNPESKKYKQIIEGLKTDYVLYYRLVKGQNADGAQAVMPGADSVFKKDSIKFWYNYKMFFNQDKDFISWLLSFKYDSSYGLWHQYLNPLSSTLSECHLPGLTNSRAAIILLENFLVGYNKQGIFQCFYCNYRDRSECNADKYWQVENFLASNENKTVKELRQAWQMENNHQ